MTFLAAAIPGAGPLIVAAVLGALGVWWLLPKPRNQSIALGTFTSLAAGIVLAVWLANRFGPVAADSVGTALFWLFATGAVAFATVFVVQRNPARGAIAFAFVIVSVCGLFLLLAAPFLMAATIIVYAGAIVVTFLFVLMLSQTRLASDENDRSREPMLGSLAGFSFLGLVLFALFTSSPAAATDYALPARPVMPGERDALNDAVALIAEAREINDRDRMLAAVYSIRGKIAIAVGGPDAPRGASNIPDRLSIVLDHEATKIRKQAERLRETGPRALTVMDNRLLKGTLTPADFDIVKAEMNALANDIRLLGANGELPARNVANLGYTLYSNYILAVELVGAILLVATIGAVRIAGRGEAAA